jgi:hypothetical protein
MDDFKRFLPLDKSDTNKRVTTRVRNLDSSSDKNSGDECDSDSDRRFFRLLSSKV